MKTKQVSGVADTVIDYTDGPWQVLTLTENVTTLEVVNWPPSGKAARLVLEIINTGSFSIAGWPANTRWAGAPPVVTTGAGAEDIVVLSTGTGGAKIFGSVVGQNFS